MLGADVEEHHPHEQAQKQAREVAVGVSGTEQYEFFQQRFHIVAKLVDGLFELFDVNVFVENFPFTVKQIAAWEHTEVDLFGGLVGVGVGPVLWLRGGPVTVGTAEIDLNHGELARTDERVYVDVGAQPEPGDGTLRRVVGKQNQESLGLKFRQARFFPVGEVDLKVGDDTPFLIVLNALDLLLIVVSDVLFQGRGLGHRFGELEVNLVGPVLGVGAVEGLFGCLPDAHEVVGVAPGLEHEVADRGKDDVAVGVSEKGDVIAEGGFKLALLGQGAGDVEVVPEVLDDVVTPALERGAGIGRLRVREKRFGLLCPGVKAEHSGEQAEAYETFHFGFSCNNLQNYNFPSNATNVYHILTVRIH